MMSIKVDTNSLNAKLNRIENTLRDIPSSKNMANISRACGSIAAKKFVNDINTTAKIQKNKYHHLYEWNKSGINSHRLFSIIRGASNDRVVVLTTKFIKSRTPVPIAKVLTSPGKTGKSVRRTSVFRDKASVMESGVSTSFTAKRNVVFSPNKRKIVFRRRGSHVFIKNPGGKATTGALEKYARTWERTMLRPSLNQSGLFEALSKDIVKTMSMSRYSSSDIYQCIKSVCDKYDAGSRVF